jgi:hypothetical protein
MELLIFEPFDANILSSNPILQQVAIGLEFAVDISIRGVEIYSPIVGYGDP